MPKEMTKTCTFAPCITASKKSTPQHTERGCW